jgi:hypothetical protein
MLYLLSKIIDIFTTMNLILKMRGVCTLIFWLIFTSIGFNQEVSRIKYEDYIYANNIKSVAVYVNKEISFTPIIPLGTDNSFTVRFDDMDESEKDYFYKLIHCDRNWQPSDIQEIEYIDGFNNEPLRDWEFSVNTLVDYTHYWFYLPNRQTKFKVSGNYILYVYQNGERGEVPLFTRRLMVAEQSISTGLNFVRPTNSAEIRYKQQMEVSLNIEGANIRFPERDLSIDIIQNGNWNNRLKNILPRYSASNMVTFDVFGQLTFDAVNEFRGFDIRSTNAVGFGVQTIERDKDITNAYIYSKRRDGNTYGFIFDFNGKYFIDNPESVFSTNIENLLRKYTNDIFQTRNDLITNSSTDSERHIRADYLDVYFNLESYELPGDVYVFGGFSDFQTYPSNKLKYDASTGTYKGKARIKQGYHDFMYAYVYNDKIDLTELEGNFQATENDYLVLTYFKPFGSRYDQLIGYRYYNTLNSAYLKNLR